MPKSAINQASVHQLCDEVYISTGNDPTYEEIRTALGGSFSTIRPYLQSWREQERPRRFVLPQAIRTRAASLEQLARKNGYARRLDPAAHHLDIGSRNDQSTNEEA